MPSFHTIGPNINLTYLHIPKFRYGGVSIHEWVSGHDTINNSVTTVIEGHLRLTEIRQLFPTTYTFTVVGNPWERALRGYVDLTNRLDETSKLVTVKKCGLSSWPTFEVFLENINNIDTSLLDFSGLPAAVNQSYWIDDSIDLIIKMENIDSEIAPIMAMMSPQSILDLPRVTVGNHGGDYKDHYNDATKQIISTIFAEDIERFGYSFEDG